MPLPEEVYRVLVEVVEAKREGKVITLVPHTQRLTTQEAADFLGISRPTLVKLLKDGESPGPGAVEVIETSGNSGVIYHQRSDGRIAAQLLQAAAAGRPDAPDRDTQLGADLGVRHRRVLDQHGDQPLAA